MYFNPMNLSSLLRIEFAVFDQVGPYIFLISFIDIYIYVYISISHTMWFNQLKDLIQRFLVYSELHNHLYSQI